MWEHQCIAKELSENNPVDKCFEHWKWREWKAKVPHLDYYVQSLIFWVTQQLPQKYIYNNTFYDMLIDRKHKTSQNRCGEWDAWQHLILARIPLSICECCWWSPVKSHACIAPFKNGSIFQRPGYYAMNFWKLYCIFSLRSLEYILNETDQDNFVLAVRFFVKQSSWNIQRTLVCRAKNAHIG